MNLGMAVSSSEFSLRCIWASRVYWFRLSYNKFPRPTTFLRSPLNYESRRDQLDKYRNDFAKMPHSQGIATLPSLIVLDGILNTYQITNVLEIGRGLGTLTKFMGQNFKLNIFSVEPDAYCIDESARNCAGVKYQHCNQLNHIGNSILKDLDLVVIDGPISKSQFKLIFESDKIRLYFFENHQIVTKMRVLLYLFFHGRHSRYVEIFPFHNFEGPSYIVSLPRWSNFSFATNYVALFLQLVPRIVKHCHFKLSKRQNPLTDSYRLSRWNPYAPR